MAKIMAVTVYVETRYQLWMAETWLPSPTMAHQRMRAIVDWWRDIEQAKLVLKDDGEVSMGFYLEIMDDPGKNWDDMLLQEYASDVLRPSTLDWKRSWKNAVGGRKEVRSCPNG